MVEAGDEKEIHNLGQKMESAAEEVNYIAELLAVPIRAPAIPALDDLPALKSALTTLLGQMQEVPSAQRLPLLNCSGLGSLLALSHSSSLALWCSTPRSRTQ